MTDMQKKRAFVSDLYSGPGWKKKVERMSDEQVIAIFLRKQEGQMPEHEPQEEIHEFPVVDIPVVASSGLGPHWNEDDFPIY